MKKIVILLSAFGLLMAGCKKTDLAGNNPTGEGLVGFTLLTPSSGTKVVLNSATPSQAINFTWNPSKPGLTTAPTYKVVAVLRSGGDFNTPMLEFPSNNSGAATSLTLTYQQLDAALQAKAVAAGALTELSWSVKANNGDVTVQATTAFNLTVTRFQNGSTPFKLLAPVPTTTPLEINPTSTADNFTFRWTKSVPATGSPAVTYRILFAERKLDGNGNEIPINWATQTLFRITPGNNGADSFAVVSYQRLSDSVAAHGWADLGLQVNLKWTVEATSGNWKQLSDYQNNLFFLRQVKFYLVGGVQNPAWDINNPLEMITDKKSDRYGKVFYTYVKLDAGTEFKFFKTKGDWGSGYGNNGTSGAGFTTGYNVGGNFSVASTGIYRLTLDVGTNMAYIQQKQVGVVGGMQGWDPGAPLYGG
ncbi:MAG TPA: SusE domain-containing protein, partial [Chitinophagaceae bacterium]